jgi:hypothetical protein
MTEAGTQATVRGQAHFVACLAKVLVRHGPNEPDDGACSLEAIVAGRSMAETRVRHGHQLLPLSHRRITSPIDRKFAGVSTSREVSGINSISRNGTPNSELNRINGQISSSFTPRMDGIEASRTRTGRQSGPDAFQNRLDRPAGDAAIDSRSRAHRG